MSLMKCCCCWGCYCCWCWSCCVVVVVAAAAAAAAVVVVVVVVVGGGGGGEGVGRSRGPLENISAYIKSMVLKESLTVPFLGCGYYSCVSKRI